jgi:hypothetical protein
VNEDVLLVQTRVGFLRKKTKQDVFNTGVRYRWFVTSR